MERRAYPRVPIDVPWFAEIHFASGEPLSVLLIDISQGGAQAGIPPQESFPADLLGREVSLCKLPETLVPGKGPKNGRITWVSPQRCGIQFTEKLALSPDAIATFMKIL